MTRFQWTTLTLCLMTLLLSVTLAQAAPKISNCQILPSDNPWNTDISGAPVDPSSATYIANINANGGDFVHPDFGSDPTYGIPYVVVPGSQPKKSVIFDYDDESDPGPYPIPDNPPIEAGSDHHILMVDQDNCVLYELFDARLNGSQWEAGSGAIFDLRSNKLRPDGWTSADAAGLPILPGLARCDEANAGDISHALRFTVRRTRRAYIYPATHFASTLTGAAYPPMGLRFRLKANYNETPFSGQALTIVKALKHYGMMIADNGSNWYISGETNPGCWDDDQLNQLKTIPGTAFEVIVSPPRVDVTPLRNFFVTNQPTLSWNGVSWAQGYEVQISTSAAFNGAYNTSAEVAAAPTQWQTPVLPNGWYYWRVRAKVSATTWGAWSAAESFTVNAP